MLSIDWVDKTVFSGVPGAIQVVLQLSELSREVN